MATSTTSKQSSTFINRETSWLEFNQRVLDQAIDPSVRLLERIKFLAITASNLDEFFMVRVGGLRLQQATSSVSTDAAGMTVAEQLQAIDVRTRQMLEQQFAIFLQDLEPELGRQGIQRVEIANCGVLHSEAVQRIFQEEIFAVLSPIGIDAQAEFPLLASRALHLCVQLESDEEDVGHRFAIIPLGSVLPRVLTLPTDQGFSFALLEDVVEQCVQEFFPAERLLGSTVFRITRNADISIQEDAAADLMHGMKEILQQRKTADCVRLEIDENAAASIVEFLQSSLAVDESQTFRTPGPIDLTFLMQLAGLEGFQHLRDDPWPAQRSPQIDPARSMFETIADRDILLSHPYEGYGPVVRLIEEAADDPDVLAIKQTLYRTSRDSAIVNALRRAAERGKYVTTIVELKARFDEARNIEWAQELEQAGVHVIYGVRNLKTHAKACVIVRREARGIMRYVHFGTGNYNESTARLYSDLSYFTCRDELGQDASAFFNAVTGYSQPQQY
ncbi:MAG: polyphosphate kinase 1, partial [Planctomycetota bacterium]